MAQEKIEESAAREVAVEESPLDRLLSQVNLKSSEGDEGERQASERISQALNLLVHAVTQNEHAVERVDKILIDKVIGMIDRKISDQVNEILHDEQFQAMESAWRSLKYLVDRTDFRRNIKIEVLNVSKEDLLHDFEEATETLQSGLFKHVYEQEYDQAGGEPFGAIIGNYEFGHKIPDVALLRDLAKVSAAGHAPFIGSVGAEFFGCETIEQLPLLPDVAPRLEQHEYIPWRSFRDSEDSRYVGLTLPRFLLREPYSPDTYPAKSFHFVEDASGQDHSKYLWGHASMAFGTCLSRSFADNGWCVNIRGPQSGGLVEELPMHFYEAAGEATYKIPTEILISDRREYELSELGFIPLAFYKNNDFACFFSANSTQKPAEYVGPDGDFATANSRLSSRLPYLFLTSRLAHNLKVIQRENIGAAKEREDLQIELEKWINELVTEMPHPDAELKARCPLREAQIEVHDIADNPGFYNVSMMVRPHFQIEGVNVSLSLVSRLPKAKA